MTGELEKRDRDQNSRDGTVRRRQPEQDSRDRTESKDRTVITGQPGQYSQRG